MSFAPLREKQAYQLPPDNALVELVDYTLADRQRQKGLLKYVEKGFEPHLTLPLPLAYTLSGRKAAR